MASAVFAIKKYVTTNQLLPKGKFKWVDITIPKNLARYPSINLRDALMNLHVVEGKNIKSGVDAFTCIWSELGYFKLLGFTYQAPYHLSIGMYSLQAICKLSL